MDKALEHAEAPSLFSCHFPSINFFTIHAFPLSSYPAIRGRREEVNGEEVTREEGRMKRLPTD